ncbi:Tripeptidyl-peptidase sed4 [Teratosphaeria destructans]|uniref:tripeptidyl-peptidase II n=1 Tax=Teratosphaeria destructans TaxID=418781 RepID=A0A9W7SYN6_9PEZI|nr:Tripeptidyl-peptidase sed4 [Teratosphaeria destructans]
MYSVTSVLLTLAAVSHAAVHESLSALPYGWSKFDQTVPSSAQIKLHVSLAYRNLGQLESRLAAVSTPGSPDYGKYIDLAEQQAIFAPANESASQVIAWLQQAGAQDIAWDGHAVSFVSTVQQANSLLEAEFSLYSNGDTVKLRTTRYSIPDDLSGAIDLISPTTYFGSTTAQGISRARTSASKTQDAPPTKRQFSSSCETVIVVSMNRTYDVLSPLCLKELYNIGNYSVDKSAGSSIAFGSFLNQSASYSDLAVFERMFNIPSQNFSVLALINGGVDNQNSTTEQDGEANLDVQNIIGLVDGLPVGEYITGGLPPFIPDLLTPNKSTEQNEPYLPYYQYLLSQPNSNLPHVITNSYGDHENTVPERYAKRVCHLIGIMGLRGRTILESAGDEGVGAVCLDNRNGKPQFTPQFPGTCPYITAVGGTQFTTPEYAWNASSGGFSNYFPTAFYQKQAVQTYLDDHISPATKAYYANNGYANFSGRGFPDISAHSLSPDYLTVIDGMPEPNGGTSAASPVVASIFALLNDARFRAGQPALGFANPLLYALDARNSSGINDIIYGGSLGCSGVDLQNGEVIQGAGIIPYAR